MSARRAQDAPGVNRNQRGGGKQQSCFTDKLIVSTPSAALCCKTQRDTSHCLLRETNKTTVRRKQLCSQTIRTNQGAERGADRTKAEPNRALVWKSWTCVYFLLFQITAKIKFSSKNKYIHLVFCGFYVKMKRKVGDVGSRDPVLKELNSTFSWFTSESVFN